MVISQFLGESDDPTPMTLDQRQASTMLNLYPLGNRGSYKLARRLGTAPLAASQGARDVDGILWGKLGSTEYLLVFDNGSVYDYYVSQTVPLSGGSNIFTPGLDVNGAWVEGKAYFSDGVHGPYRFDGTTVRFAMPQKPDGSLMTLALNGVHTGRLGDYFYTVTFTSADGKDSEPFFFDTGLGVGPIHVVNNAITVSGIPTCPVGQDCSGRRIWRLGPNQTIFRLAKELNDNTTTSFVDSATDSDLENAEQLRTNVTRFPACQDLIEYQGRLVGASCQQLLTAVAGSAMVSSGDTRTVYIANYLEPYYCPEVPQVGNASEQEQTADGTRATLQDPAAGIITGLATNGFYVGVFTGGAGYILQGDSPNTFTLNKFGDHGCVAHRTIQNARGTFIWEGPDGTYAYSREQDTGILNRISDDNYYTFLNLAASGMSRGHAYIWYDRYYLTLPGIFSKWYDLKTQTWGTNDNQDSRCSTVTVHTSTKRERIYAAKTGAAQVWQYETGSTDNGTPITVEWVSKDWDMGLQGREKRVYFAGAKFRGGSGLVTIALMTNGGTVVDSFTHSLTGSLVQGYTLSAPNVSKFLRRMAEQCKDEFFRLSVTSANTDPFFELTQIELHWRVAS
jgi:hypothetical protein